jgi:hypothetical protein
VNEIQQHHWDEYAIAGFTYWPGDAAPVSVAPRKDKHLDGTFPFAVPASFVTAHNPGGPVIDPAENSRRHLAFLADIATHGWAWFPAVGGDPAGSHAEDGVLLLDASPADALALAARFEQDAIYVWSAHDFELIACDGSRHDHLGWTASVGATALAHPGYR